jgi:large subunit ribosomal protein L18
MATTVTSKLAQRQKRHQRIRKKVSGSAERPRLCVFRSSKHIYAQLIDDRTGRTLVASSSCDEGFAGAEGSKGSNVAGARRVGELLAGKAASQGIQAAVFDRAGYQYHGRVQALAEGARSQGLAF